MAIREGMPGAYDKIVPDPYVSRDGTKLILEKPINYEKVVTETFCKILGNKGFNIDAEDDKVKSVLDQFVLDNQFKVMFIQIIQLCSEQGYCIPILEKTKGGSVMLSFAEPQFIQKISKLFINDTAAIVYRKSPNIDDTSFFIRQEYNDTYVINTSYSSTGAGDKFNLEQVSATIDNDKQPLVKLDNVKKQKHMMNCVPVGIIYNKNYFLYGRYQAITQAIVKEQSDVWNARGAFELSNRILTQLYKELVINRSRFVGNFSPSELQAMARDGDLREIFNDILVTKTPEQGSTKTVNFQFLQANPVLEKYVQAYLETFKIAMRAVGISENDTQTGTQKTSGEIAMVLNNTTETLKLRRLMLAEQVMVQILDKVLKANDIEPIENGKRKYNFDIVGTDMLDESNLTSVLIQQIEAGLATREYGVGRLRNINTADAEQAIKEIDEKRERDMDAMSMLTMEGDNNDGKPEASIKPTD